MITPNENIGWQIKLKPIHICFLTKTTYSWFCTSTTDILKHANWKGIIILPSWLIRLVLEEFAMKQENDYEHYESIQI